MEFNLKTEDLIAGVSIVERTVSTRSTLPIIGNILFEAQKGELKLSANNLEMGVEVRILAEVKGSGSILIPGKTLGGIVPKLPQGDIAFKISEKGMVKISYKESSFSIHGLPADEFPALLKVKDGKTFYLDTADFLKLVKKTIFAVSTSEDKYVLSGVLLEVGKTKDAHDPSNLRMIATDGYRLARAAAQVNGLESITCSAIVPAKALSEFSKIVQQKEDKIKIIISNDQIAFEHSNAYLVSRLIQGQFPDYRQVVPKKAEIKILLPADQFLDAAERSAVIAGGSANVVKIEIAGKKVHLVASTPDVGSVDEVILADVRGGEKTQIAFNIKLIIDALKAIDTEQVELELSGPLSPGIIKPVGGEDFLYITMPIRTQETAA